MAITAGLLLEALDSASGWDLLDFVSNRGSHCLTGRSSARLYSALASGGFSPSVAVGADDDALSGGEAIPADVPGGCFTCAGEDASRGVSLIGWEPRSLSMVCKAAMGIKAVGKLRCPSSVAAAARSSLKLWMLRATTTVLLWTCVVQFTAVGNTWTWGPRVLKGWPSCRTAREAAAVTTTTRLAMPEPVVEKAPLPPKSEYCRSAFHRFRMFWNGSTNCMPMKMRFYVDHFLFRFCALTVASHLVEHDNLLLDSFVKKNLLLDSHYGSYLLLC